MTPIHEVVSNRKYGNATPDHHCPIEAGRRRIWCRWEADHDYAKGQEEQREDVDSRPCHAKVPSRLCDCILREAVQKSAGDGNPVRGEDGDRGQGGDDVEGDDRAKRYQRKQRYDDEGDED